MSDTISTNTASVQVDGGQDTKTSEPEKTFTQADLDRVVQERLAREREKYKDYAELKKLAEEYQKLKEEQMSDQERLQKRVAELEQQSKTALQKANERLVQAEVKLLATEMGIIDPDAALALMDRDSVTVTADGVVEGVREALEKLLKAKPYLRRQQQAVGSGSNPANTGDITPEKFAKMSYTERVALYQRNPELYNKLALGR